MFENNFAKLKFEAYILGYHADVISDKYASNVNHEYKLIGISKSIGEREAIFEFAHELGHVEQYIDIFESLTHDGKRAEKFYKVKHTRVRFLIKEAHAWFLGYKYLKRNDINTKGYYKHAVNCLASYIYFWSMIKG